MDSIVAKYLLCVVFSLLHLNNDDHNDKKNKKKTFPIGKKEDIFEGKIGSSTFQ